MKKIKYLLYLIISICLTILIVSNWPFFSTKYAFDVNLYHPLFQWPLKLDKIEHHFQPVATGLYFLGCLLIGFLYANFRNLVYRFKSNKHIKSLEVTSKSQAAKIEELEKEVNFLQRNSSKPAPQSSPVVVTPVDSEKESNEFEDTKVTK